MNRICPNPMTWHRVYQRLCRFAEINRCNPQSPPKPLILAGWVYTNDLDKSLRWEESVAWARKNGCRSFVENIRDKDYYSVEVPTSHIVGPLYGTMEGDYRTEGEAGRVTREDAKEIAERAIRDRMLGVGVSSVHTLNELKEQCFSEPLMYNGPDLARCWIAYAVLPGIGLKSNHIVAVDRQTGAVLYVGSANDEG